MPLCLLRNQQQLGLRPRCPLKFREDIPKHPILPWAGCGEEPSENAGPWHHPSHRSLYHNQLNSARVAGETPLGLGGQKAFGNEVWGFILIVPLLTRGFSHTLPTKREFAWLVLAFSLPSYSEVGAVFQNITR